MEFRSYTSWRRIRQNTFEEGYYEEYITDILPIHHWQTTDILPTADRKVAIDTTDIERVVIASIDCHSIECQRKLKVCRPRCPPRVNRDVDRVSIDRRSRDYWGVDQHSILGVNSTHDPGNASHANQVIVTVIKKKSTGCISKKLL